MLLTHPSMDVPVAPARLLRKAVAVYPEIVSGNPLGAPHVVRWLLNRPGFFGHPVDFGPNELMFFYQEAFRADLPGIDPDNLLRVRWLRTDIYTDRGLPGRQGACRMIRKGARTGLAAVPENDPAIRLDGKSHSQIADIFNRTDVFYCHDPYTMYCYYAALCGCVPVVLPQPGLNANDWRAAFEMKRGVAYGEEEVNWAAATRADLLADMQAAIATEDSNVLAFAQKVRAAFGT
jgi:hypothetical protein